MQMQSVTFVRSMYPSKGVIESNGMPFDNTKVHIDTPLTSNKEGFGIPSPQMNWGTSENYHTFIAKYPQILKDNKEFEATITWENQTSGKTAVLVVVDIVPFQKSTPVANKA